MSKKITGATNLTEITIFRLIARLVELLAGNVVNAQHTQKFNDCEWVS